MKARFHPALGMVFVVALVCLGSTVLAVPGLINYQGLLSNPMGERITGTYTMRFILYDPVTGGLAWSEEQSVVVTDGIYNVQLGSVSPLSSDLFDADEAYLGVEIYNPETESWETFSPRQRLTSTAYAFQAENAQALQGFGSGDFAPSVHEHSGDDITTGTVDEARIDPDIARDSEITWGNLLGIPADIADGDQVGIMAETDPTITNPSIKDGVSWGELSGIPSGFADNVDNDSGGDITGVTAGTGLTGGGASGNVSIGVEIPFILSGSASGGLIAAANTSAEGSGTYGYASGGSGNGVYGYASGTNGCGVRGVASGTEWETNFGGHFSASAIRGIGVYGITSGSDAASVFGRASGSNGRAVEGIADYNGNVFNYGGYFSAAGTYGRGVYGQSTGSSGRAVMGYATGADGMGVYGQTLGPDGRAVYGLAGWDGNATNYGGHFTANGTLGRGIYAEGANTGEVRNFGGYFRAKGRDGWGVYAEALGTNGIAVYGKATSSQAQYDFFAGGVGNYGAFTGAHEVRFASDMPGEIRPGMILSVTGKAEKRVKEDSEIALSSTLPTVTLTQKPMDKAVLGVLVSQGPLHEDHWYEAREGERFGVVNALGEGRMWVCSSNGQIEAGDYLTSSEIPGYGQRQDDDLVHSYTVGKAIETVDWEAVAETVEHQGRQVKVYLIAVVYTSG